MKFGIIKIGKSKEESGSTKATKIAGLEEQLNGRTNNLKQTEAQLKKLSNKGKNSKGSNNVSARPHGPIGELSLDQSDGAADTFSPEEENEATSDASEGGIKMVEVKPGDARHGGKDEKIESIGDSLNSLFAHDDDEENPLASLIRTLPDVDTNELMEDLNEIKNIIKDWRKK